MSLTRAQCKAARAMVGWTQEQLAEAAGVGATMIETFETGRSRPHEANRQRLRSTLEQAGVMFIDDGAASQRGGPGVRIKGLGDQ